jgi:hypothetical protein
VRQNNGAVEYYNSDVIVIFSAQPAPSLVSVDIEHGAVKLQPVELGRSWRSLISVQFPTLRRLAAFLTQILRRSILFHAQVKFFPSGSMFSTMSVLALRCLTGQCSRAKGTCAISIKVLRQVFSLPLAMLSLFEYFVPTALVFRYLARKLQVYSLR